MSSSQPDRLKPAVIRPPALRAEQDKVRYARREGGTRVTVKVAKATNAAFDQIERDPGIGSPTLGKRLGRSGLRTLGSRSSRCFGSTSSGVAHLDVTRLPGKRQDIAEILGDQFSSD